ncbi:MAG: NAD(P)H-dependent oxidoreductase [Gemmatimonadales bacterium]|nr:NAD(P)H-dependent oxidoreductase [Gemmatimonadales bacterium]
MFAASFRRGSYNKKLIRLAASLVRDGGASVDLAEFAEFPVPMYNADDEEASGIPAGARAFAERLGAASGVVISSPEYNNSMPGTIKNLIDWVSRIRPLPFKGKHGFLLSASPSMVGGNRALWALRVPLESLGVVVYPAMFSLAQANKAFTENGSLQDPKLTERLGRTVKAYIHMAHAIDTANSSS